MNDLIFNNCSEEKIENKKRSIEFSKVEYNWFRDLTKLNFNPNWFDGLKDDDKKHIIKNLRSENNKNQKNKIHELAVFHLLFKSGIKNIRYEFNNEGREKLPDWTILKDNGEVNYTIEVFTLNTEEKIEKSQIFKDNLELILNTINHDVNLSLEFNIEVDYENYKAQRPQEIKEKIDEWLKSQPAANDNINIGIYKFTLVEYTEKGYGISISKCISTFFTLSLIEQ